MTDWSSSLALHRIRQSAPSTLSYTPFSNPETPQSAHNQLALKKAWDNALAPAKSLPLNLFMMYMAGNSIQIFSIMIVVMMCWTPIKGILSLGSLYSGKGMLSVMLVHALMFLLQLCLGVWKLGSMGLLPTSESDWLAFVRPSFVERTLGPLIG